MVFSSLTFLFVFLPVVFAAYFLLPKSFRNYVLLAASLFFYAWGEPVYIILMVLSILFNYAVGCEMESKDDNPSARKKCLLFALAVNIGLLALFKYCFFLHLALPIGISFYTFQALSYVIDLYIGKIKAQKNLFTFALYICMFPQLIAGPIVRYIDVEKQLKNRTVTFEGFGAGARLFIIGLAKKVLLANAVGRIFAEITSASAIASASAWVGAIAYMLQIYFDFSGYSDMAIGLGRMFGFKFNINFDMPYTSKSITDFWRRWHISLSTWFKEYVYIPLCGNRKGVPRQMLNLLIVWALTGIWHGAGLNFLFWGLYYAVFLILEKFVLARFLEKIPALFRHLYSLFIVLIGWVFFFSESLPAAFSYLKSMFTTGAAGFATAMTGSSVFYHWLLWIVCIFACTTLARSLRTRLDKTRRRAWIVNIIYLAAFFLCIAALVGDSYNPFLYFRF